MKYHPCYTESPLYVALSKCSSFHKNCLWIRPNIQKNRFLINPPCFLSFFFESTKPGNPSIFPCTTIVLNNPKIVSYALLNFSIWTIASILITLFNMPFLVVGTNLTGLNGDSVTCAGNFSPFRRLGSNKTNSILLCFALHYWLCKSNLYT